MPRVRLALFVEEIHREVPSTPDLQTAEVRTARAQRLPGEQPVQPARRRQRPRMPH